MPVRCCVCVSVLLQMHPVISGRIRIIPFIFKADLTDNEAGD